MDLKNLKIGIIGLGPVGLILACHLKDIGCQTIVCDRIEEKIRLIRNHGISLTGQIKKSCLIEFSYTSIFELLECKPDILFCSSKAYQVDFILEQVFAHNKNSELLIVAPQNGIGITDIYLKRFDKSQLLRMVVNYAGIITAPNSAEVTFFNPPNYIASVDDSKNKICSWLAGALSSAGLTTELTDSRGVRNKAWIKLIFNTGLSAFCAITRQTMYEAISHPDTYQIIEGVITESISVAEAQGIILPSGYFETCMSQLENAGNHFPSLACDFINGRETEIDFMNGKIVEYGRKHGISTPVNLTLTRLVRVLSKS